mgnify:FL=1
MFSKLKQIKDLRDQAKDLQGKLSQETVEGTAAWGKVKIKMNGNQEVLSVSIEPELLSPSKKADVENAIKEAVGEANKKAQKVMAEKVRAGGINIPGLK